MTRVERFERALPAAVGLLAAAVWLGPATPNHVFPGLFGHETNDWIGYDLELYLEYARQIADGALPYRDFDFEYPPLSALLVAAPHLFGEEPQGYRAGFEMIVGLLIIATAVASTLAARARGLDWRVQAAAGGFVAVGPWIIGGGLVADRLDPLPTMFLAFAVLAAARASFGVSGAMAGLGAAAKLWPAVFAPSLVALAARRSGRADAERAGIAFAIALAVPFAAALILAPGGLVDSFEYHLDRPLQTEAMGATGLLVLEGVGIGGPYTVESGFGSLNLADGAVVGTVETFSSLLGAVALCATLVIGARRILGAADDGEAFDLAIRTTLAAVLVLLVFGKVLSPQFLTWLLPLPLLIGRGRWLALGLSVAVLALTNLAFTRFFQYLDFKSEGILLFSLRDLALIALLAVVAYPLLARSPPEPARGGPAEARVGAG